MNRLQHRRSNTASTPPTLTQMLEGEIAINLADKDVYFSNGSEVIQLNHLKNAKTDSTHRYVTDAQMAAWSSNQSALGFTPVNKAGDTMLGDLVLSGDPLVSNGAANKSYVDAAISAVTGKYRAPVQTLTALAAIASSSILDKALCLVEDAGSLYHYDSQSALANDGFGIITPTDAPSTGRWLKIQAATQSHEALLGLLGGTSGDHQHLTTTELNAVNSHIVDATKHLTSAQHTWLNALTVTATEINHLTGVTSDIQTQIDSKQGDLGYAPVSKAGDTMAGALILHADPTTGAMASNKTYVDTVAGSTLDSAKSYADGVASTTVTTAEGYADGLLVTAEAYSDSKLIESKVYADTKDGDAQTVAKAYTDDQVVIAKAYSDTTSGTALTSAKTYADGLHTTALEYTDTKIGDAGGHATTVASDALIAAKAYADDLVVNLWDDRGMFNAASTNLYPTTGGSGIDGAVIKGDIWEISSPANSGPLLGFPVGSTVRALADNPGQIVVDWAVGQVGLGYVPGNIANPLSQFAATTSAQLAGVISDETGTGFFVLSDSPTFTGNVGGLTKTMVGLSNVDNTSDIDKPVSTATQAALDLKVITKAAVGLSNVDNTSDLDKPISTATQAAMDFKVITKEAVGLSNVDNTSDLNKPVSTAAQLIFDLLNKGSVGLGNVDNTSDLNKPISTAVQAALDLKVITKEAVGLGNVDNTSDIDKPVSTAQSTAIGLKESSANKGVADGYAPLNGAVKIDVSYLPDSVVGALQYKGVWNALTNTPNITDVESKGVYYVTNVAGATDLSGIIEWEVGDWVVSNGVSWDKIDNTDAVSSVNGRLGSITLTSTDVGLGNVDNTSDLDKPVSTAVQTALDLKVITKEALGLSNVDNTSDLNKPVSTAVQTALDLKVITKEAISLGNVDNTSDINKPVSTAQQAALNLKYTPIIGEIKLIGFTAIPEKWLACDGSIVSRTTYSDLFAVIGETFSAGDGVTTFSVPYIASPIIEGVYIILASK